MPPHLARPHVLAPAAGLLLLAACAPSTPFAAVDPADPAHGAPMPAYRSPFLDQPAFAVVDARPWRESNDLVRRLGGAAGHLREPAAPGGDAGDTRPARP